jgi:inosine-uridine nucleoside N-ribohydrolase
LVFSAGFRKLTLVPLDATHRALVSLDDCARLRALGTPAGRATADITEPRIAAHDQSQRMEVAGTAPVHDALAVASLIDPSVITTRRLHVAVETTGRHTVGRTVIDTEHRGGGVAQCEVAFDANARKFVGILTETFALT